MNSDKNLEKKRILVLGGNGKTGSRVLQRLAKLGWPTQIGSRSANPKFDWEDSATWQPALQNINSVYVAFQPDIAIPGAVETIRKFSKTAVDCGVKKLVLLSGRGEAEAQACEEVVKKAGAEWTIIRASWFDQNFSEGFLLEPVLAGHMALPAGDVGEPFIDVDDIADVAVAALTQGGHNGNVYEVTGPRLLTFRQAMAEITIAAGREVRFEQISVQDYASALAEHGVPADFISFITYLFAEVLDGRNEKIGDGVKRALGREPTDFREFVRKAAASGAWNK